MLSLLLKKALWGGVLTGLVCGILFFLLKKMGFSPLEQQRFVYLPLYFVGIVLTLRFFAIESQQGVIPHWQSLTISLIVNLLAALVYAFLVGVFLEIFAQWLSEHQAALVAKVQKDLSQADEANDKKLYASLLEDVRKVGFFDVIIDIWLKTSLIGFVMAMAAGIVFRKYK